MESSSDNSFAWTDTSTDSVSSTSMATNAFNENNTHKSEKHFNKKKEKLSRINESIDLKADMDIKEEANFNNIKNCIKLEPDSENDFKKKKKRNKHLECNGTQNESQDSASYDETYLNMKVKLEDVSSKKHKQKKRKHSSSVDSNSINSSCEGNHKHTHTLNQESEDDTIPMKSKKIKKFKKEDGSNNRKDQIHSIEPDVSVQEQTFKNYETNYNNCSVIENNTLQDGSEEESNDEISAIKCDDSHVVHAISFIDKSLEKSKSRTKKISDRIRFEDDNDSTVNESSPEEDDNPSEYSKKPFILKKVLKNNPNLKKVLHSFNRNTCINQNDEIWVLKCPREINISDFTNTTLNIHGKCKVKVAGQTYEGSAEEEQSDALSLLALDHNKLKIKNISLNGVISLRKRIPKAHFRDDNIMVNNQSNFIPLPETKCRHPLFGSNYKKSLKIPAAISERLNMQANGEVVKTEKRKKKKDNINENKAAQIDLQKQSGSEMKSEPGLPAEVREKKKKKRKLLDDEGPARKKAKCIKTDPESAEAWESEKAIEENLFNF